MHHTPRRTTLSGYSLTERPRYVVLQIPKIDEAGHASALYRTDSTCKR